MYKVMVVDDELWGRRAISKMISELNLDAEVIAEARHGEEALKLIGVSKPHIVVTDMNMPVMDGLQFLEHLHEHHSDIRVIVISGYSQFEYLHGAIRYQACEYLLKPVSIGELRSAMIKAAELSSTYRSHQQQKKEAVDLLKLKRSAFLQNVTAERITNPSDILKHQEELQISSGLEYSRLVVMMFRHFQETARTRFHGNADLLMFSIENILHELLQDELALVYKSDDRLRICLVQNGPLTDGSQGPAWLPEFHKAVQRMLKLEVCAGLSPSFSELAELPHMFRAANKAIGGARLHDSGCGLYPAEDQIEVRSGGQLTSFDLQALRQAVASGNVKEVRELLHNYLTKVTACGVITISEVQQELARIMDVAVSELKVMASARPTVFDPQSITGIMDGREVTLLLSRWLEAIEEYSTDRNESESIQMIQSIAAFLDDHYFEDISLIDVATRFHMDPSYLSKLFKTVTSENFIEYLTRRRMEKACELLRASDRKISDISELVGYENQRYFSQVFKKSTGQTPSEYRDSPLQRD
ncbi:hypothetical protein A8L34_15660 [Bacillus sp. FJAT-27264]|uniref:response regulator transcription factor n=1 Tax=Paenibacillus sp. (strain DSM 101736 / FJAT-27264) TaxID=1850362 RepID=UPI0008080E12|nr:helix-turn-helix domain-containing protein [Bacillus sp. FJAT-27264]OBZ11771.1 hypothetical protein A8L34_15660 [Bacillus sp. FJAT-27264]